MADKGFELSRKVPHCRKHSHWNIQGSLEVNDGHGVKVAQSVQVYSRTSQDNVNYVSNFSFSKVGTNKTSNRLTRRTFSRLKTKSRLLHCRSKDVVNVPSFIVTQPLSFYFSHLATLCVLELQILPLQNGATLQPKEQPASRTLCLNITLQSPHTSRSLCIPSTNPAAAFLPLPTFVSSPQ